MRIAYGNVTPEDAPDVTLRLMAAMSERGFFIDNLLVRIRFIIVMIKWTGLASWVLNILFQVALHLPSCYRGTCGLRTGT